MCRVDEKAHRVGAVAHTVVPTKKPKQVGAVAHTVVSTETAGVELQRAADEHARTGLNNVFLFSLHWAASKRARTGPRHVGNACTGQRTRMPAQGQTIFLVEPA